MPGPEPPERDGKHLSGAAAKWGPGQCKITLKDCLVSIKLDRDRLKLALERMKPSSVQPATFEPKAIERPGRAIQKASLPAKYRFARPTPSRPSIGPTLTTA